MNDELLTVIKKIRTTGIAGERCREKKRPEPEIELDTARGIRTATLLLSDGQWHQTNRLRSIAKLYGIAFDYLAGMLELAESDSGHFLALPNDPRTPLTAPDESRRKNA